MTGAMNGEQSIGSDATPGGIWNSVACGGALAGTESEMYVIIQYVVYVKKQQATTTNLDQRAWNYDSSWAAAGV